MKLDLTLAEAQGAAKGGAATQYVLVYAGRRTIDNC